MTKISRRFFWNPFTPYLYSACAPPYPELVERVFSTPDCGRVLDPFEAPFDLTPCQPQHDRPPMGAHRRVGCPPQFIEQILHLLPRERIVRLDGGVTGHRRGDPAKRVVDA